MSNGNFVSKYDVEGAWIGRLEGPMVGSRPAKIKSRFTALEEDLELEREGLPIINGPCHKRLACEGSICLD